MNDNPRAVMGDNVAPDYAQEVTNRMAADYAELTRSADAALTEARELPKEVSDDNAMGQSLARGGRQISQSRGAA